MSPFEKEPPAVDLAEVDLASLLRALLSRVEGALDERARWELLLDAVVAMAADLSLDALLGQIVEAAGRLVGARYAALGVMDRSRNRRLRTFVHHGMSAEGATLIGDLPTGHGLLGRIIDHPEPLRLRDIAEHPDSYGFPAHHPPMHSFLGVPVRAGERVFGNLYLTEKHDGLDFTEQDERIVVSLAAAAGVAIDNALLREQAVRREEWLAATAEITGLLVDAAGGDAAEPLQMVADRARVLAGADAAWVVPAEGGLRTTVFSGLLTGDATRPSIELSDTAVAEVIHTGRAVSVDDLSEDAAQLSDTTTTTGLAGPTLIVPLETTDGVHGALALGWLPERADSFRELDASLPAGFVEQVTVALQIARAQKDKERLVVFEDRDRIARDLHDLVIQRLFAIGLGLERAVRHTGEDTVRQHLDTAVEDIDDTIREIRRAIFELGSEVRGQDVQAEVSGVVGRVATSLAFRPELRFEGPVRSLVRDEVTPDLLAVLSEALSNAARHAHAHRITVLVTVETGGELRLQVDDDGVGVSPDVVESGLANIRARASRHDGRCEVSDSPTLHGTRVLWAVPL